MTTEPEAIPADVDPAGRPLNEAGWALTTALPGPVPGYIFNAIKPALRVAIQRYLAEAAALDRASRAPVDGAEAKPDRWELLETLDSGSIRWSVFEHRQQAHNAMVASDFVAVIRPLYPHPAPASPDVDWRDDPSADERWNAGLDFGMEQLCKAIGVDPQQVTWDAATETVDGDVQSVIWNILRTAYGEDFPPAPSPDAEMVRPIVGIENRTAQEVFDIMSDRIRLRFCKHGGDRS